MIQSLSYILWDPKVSIFSIGSFTIRWYSFFWLVGLVAVYFIVRWLFIDQKLGKEKCDPLFVYCFVGIILGCRLGHCLFYEPDYFLSSGKHIIEMFLPIHFMADGGVKFIGYEGLASHGGTLGLIIALLVFYRRYKVPVWQLLDNIAIGTPITCCCIRLGNLMNSEIIGKITDVPWAFIFERVDMFPRHPSQLYEAIAYLIFLFVGLFFYKIKKTPVGRGFYFGLCLTLIFSFRFFIEFTKEDQVAFEQGMLFNMGQLLSIPFVVFGVWCMWSSRRRVKKA